ncbi:hypothetical protein FGB62_301g01 [Gracilaria domingensis]|nr:hypothetical protein FGB62_301g01 [Gracilaria domingensis]
MTSAMGCSPFWPSYLAAPQKLDEPSPPTLDPLLCLDVCNGFQCDRCLSCYTDKKPLAVHLRKAHNVTLFRGSNGGIAEHKEVKVQRIFSTGRLRRYFSVSMNKTIGELTVVSNIDSLVQITPNEVRNSSDHDDTIADNSNSTQGEDARVSMASSKTEKMLNGFCSNEEGVNVQDKLKSTFVSISKVDDVLKARSKSMNVVHSLASIGQSDPPFHCISADVNSYLETIPKLTLDIPHSVLIWCNLRSKGERRDHFRTVTEKTRKQYATELCRFILFLYRALQLRPDIVDQGTLAVLKEYMALCSSKKVSIILPSTKKSDCERLKPLHELFKSTLLKHWPLCQSTARMDVKTFFSCRCVNDDGGERYRFHEAWEITKPLAALQYAISCCAIVEVHVTNQMLQANPCDDAIYEARFTKIKDAVMVNQNTVASYVRSMLDCSMGLLYQEDIDVSFEACLHHSYCGIVRDTHLSLKDLGRKVSKSHRKIEDLFSKLLFGNGMPDGFQSQIGSLHDDLSENSIGFSFLSYQRERLWMKKNIAHVLLFLQVPGTSEEVNGSAPNEDIVTLFGSKMRKSVTIEWITRCQELQRQLLFCIHISSGSLARATELSTLRLKNDTYGMRNIFMSQGRIMIITRWSKTRNLKGFAHPIPRFLDQTTSDLFIKYLMLIRSLETSLVGLFHGRDAAAFHWTRLFVNNGVPTQEAQIRSAISKELFFKDIQLKFNDYRGYNVGMVPLVAEGKAQSLIEEIRKNSCSIGHEQAGHSFEVAERAYA